MQPDREPGTAVGTKDEPDHPEQPPILVELVDDQGAKAGVLEKVAAHRTPGTFIAPFRCFYSIPTTGYCCNERP